MKTLTTHLYWGDPSEDFSQKLAKTLFDSGADALEIGIAYTDPVCDGEVFQMACRRALLSGMNPLRVFHGIKTLRNIGYDKPIYLQSYFAPIFKIGIENFVQRAKKAGVNGFIIPDLLLEEQGELNSYCRDFGLSIIQFATVYSSNKRLKQICLAAKDFIYCISLPGVTGEKPSYNDKLFELLERLKKLTDKKLYVGFGIKSSEDVGKIINFGADGVIVGSAIARIYEDYVNENKKAELSLGKISTLVSRLKAGL